MLLLGLAIFLNHVLDFRHDRLLGDAGRGSIIVQAGVHQRLIGFRNRRQRRDQRAVIEVAVGVDALGQSEADGGSWLERLTVIDAPSAAKALGDAARTPPADPGSPFA